MHRLSDLLALAILAVLCGADRWVEVATWGRCKLEWLRTFLPLPHRIPRHDTFGRVFGRLDPVPFERCFRNWTAALAQSDGRRIAIDGKAAIHMISAWSQENQLVLGQWTTAAKSNEITAIPDLLQLLDLKGAVVTTDAMGGQKTIAAKVVEQGGDYLLQVKDNHPSLRADLELLFAEGRRKDCLGVRHEFTQDVTAGHGRVETRRLWTTDDVTW